MSLHRLQINSTAAQVLPYSLLARRCTAHLEPLQEPSEALLLSKLLDVHLLVVFQRQQRTPQEGRCVCLCQAVSAAAQLCQD